MAAKCEAIDTDKRPCRTEIERIGSMLLVDRSHDWTHFTFEPLQNAEDAPAGGWQELRWVRFDPH
jgi:hypothetical protein